MRNAGALPRRFCLRGGAQHPPPCGEGRHRAAMTGCGSRAISARGTHIAASVEPEKKSQPHPTPPCFALRPSPSRGGWEALRLHECAAGAALSTVWLDREPPAQHPPPCGEGRHRAAMTGWGSRAISARGTHIAASVEPEKKSQPHPTPPHCVRRPSPSRGGWVMPTDRTSRCRSSPGNHAPRRVTPARCWCRPCTASRPAHR